MAPNVLLNRTKIVSNVSVQKTLDTKFTKLLYKQCCNSHDKMYGTDLYPERVLGKEIYINGKACEHQATGSGGKRRSLASINSLLKYTCVSNRYLPSYQPNLTHY